MKSDLQKVKGDMLEVRELSEGSMVICIISVPLPVYYFINAPKRSASGFN